MRWAERVKEAWANPALNWTLDELTRRETTRQVVSWLRAEDWQVFWTQTFRSRHSESAAMVRWQHFLAESSLLSMLKAHMWAVEPHPNSPERHHVHALLSMKSETLLTSFMNDWRGWKEKAWRELGKALILQADEKAPIHYVLKYILKRARPANDPTAKGAATPENLWGVWTARKKESRLWS